MRLLVLILLLSLTSTVKTERRKNREREESRLNNNWLVPPGPPSLISYDAHGNCYAHDRPLVGRCVPFNDCLSAVRAWYERHITPLACNSPGTPQEHFVCCPHGGYVLPTFRPTPRKSEQACWESYFPRSSARHRRQLNEDPIQSEAVELPIRRVNMSVTKIFGGTRTQHNEHPYMCALGWRSFRSRNKGNKNIRYVFNCGCVLITQRFALTVAHCANMGGESPVVALIGGVSLNDTLGRSGGELLRIKRIIQHPQYNDEMSYNDLALIKLDKNARHSPACLWSHNIVPQQQQLTALGYGQTEFAGPVSDELLQIQLYTLDNQQCASFFAAEDKLRNGVMPGQICAGDFGARMDTCQGDSGGPLLLRQLQYGIRVPYVVGLTSFGGSCATGAPGIYTRIAYYIDWIEQEVWQS